MISFYMMVNIIFWKIHIYSILQLVDTDGVGWQDLKVFFLEIYYTGKLYR